MWHKSLNKQKPLKNVQKNLSIQGFIQAVTDFRLPEVKTQS